MRRSSSSAVAFEAVVTARKLQRHDRRNSTIAGAKLCRTPSRPWLSLGRRLVEGGPRRRVPSRHPRPGTHTHKANTCTSLAPLCEPSSGSVLTDEVSEPCNATRDTVCHCKEGSQRPAPSQHCEPSGLAGGTVVAIVLGILFPLVASVGAAVYCHRRRPRRAVDRDVEFAEPLVDDKPLREYLDYLRHHTANILDYNARPGEVVLLSNRFVQPIIVAYHRADEKRQHEFISRGKRHADIIAALREEGFTFGKLFHPVGEGTELPKLVVLVGVPGIGKTTMAQMIVNKLASGERLFRADFRVVVYIQFREVNGYPDSLSLRDLFRLHHKSLGNVADRVFANPEKVLLVLDGLDEFQKPLDLANACSDPDKTASKEAIFAGLVTRKMLMGASMLLTTRPIALERLGGIQVDRFSEITGFSRQEIKDYVVKLSDSEEQGQRLYDNLESCENLFHFCYIPAFCHIAGKVVKSYLEREQVDASAGFAAATTMTDLFSKYLYVLVAHHSPNTDNLGTAVGSLANMAFCGIKENIQMFTDKDLKRFDIDLNAVEIQKGTFLGEVFKSEAVKAVKLYTFFHLTIQEYFASLAVYLSDRNTGHSPTVAEVIAAIENCEDGRYDIFQRFFAGLASPHSWQILEACLGSPRNSCQQQIIEWLRRSVAKLADRTQGASVPTTVKNSLVSLLHCLHELHHDDTVRGIMEMVAEVDLSGVRLSPPDCAALSYVLQSKAGPLELLNLEDCGMTEEEVKRLQPALASCKVVRCGGNDLNDAGVALLLNKDAKQSHLEELHLWRCSLKESSGAIIRDIVTHIRSLKTLVLNENEIGDGGAKALAEALKERRGGCLEVLRLECCSLTEVSGSSLRDIVRVCERLRVLGLEDNELGDHGVTVLAEGIKQGGGGQSLEELLLARCSLTDESAPALRDIITAASGLKKLMLGDNNFGEAAKRSLASARSDILVDFED
uniref:NLR family CARD domain-containing protein 3-like n=1 Tax=Petromyzon marinus TaxID=7757 RepID=A0AAJ7UG76_PETMA|nr:NLR family CARD domain-containing protein 3-like [Petromyzon marinus]